MSKFKGRVWTDASNGKMVVPICADGLARVAKIKSGTTVDFTIVEPRNNKFHRKYFTLLKLAFEYWEPEPKPSDNKWAINPVKNYEQFRSDIIIMAGYYICVIRTNYDVVFQAKSISFAKMTQDEFNDLYAKTKDIIWERIIPNITGEDRTNFEQQLLQYD